MIIAGRVCLGLSVNVSLLLLAFHRIMYVSLSACVCTCGSVYIDVCEYERYR